MSTPLVQFGQSFIKEVRDSSLFVLENTITGEMKSPIDQELYKRISSLDADGVAVLRDVAYCMIDQALHNMMFFFEQSAQWQLASNRHHVESLSELSDGLAGELYSEEGWIAQFSEYPPSLAAE